MQKGMHWKVSLPPISNSHFLQDPRVVSVYSPGGNTCIFKHIGVCVCYSPSLCSYPSVPHCSLPYLVTLNNAVQKSFHFGGIWSSPLQFLQPQNIPLCQIHHNLFDQCPGAEHLGCLQLACFSCKQCCNVDSFSCASEHMHEHIYSK